MVQISPDMRDCTYYDNGKVALLVSSNKYDLPLGHLGYPDTFNRTLHNICDVFLPPHTIGVLNSYENRGTVRQPNDQLVNIDITDQEIAPTPSG